MRKALLSIVPLMFLLNCTTEPTQVTSRPDVTLPLSFDMSNANEATATWTRGSFFLDETGPLDCVEPDLVVHFYGEIPYMLHEVTSASGTTETHLQFRPVTPDGQQFHAQLFPSGRLYTLNDGVPVNQVFHFGPNQTFSFVERDIYTNVADPQDKWQAKFRVHVTLNANGTVTADRTVLECGAL
jgi:hypothetical protein